MKYIVIIISIFLLWHILLFVAYFRKSKAYKNKENEEQNDKKLIDKMLGDKNE